MITENSRKLEIEFQLGWLFCTVPLFRIVSILYFYFVCIDFGIKCVIVIYFGIKCVVVIYTVRHKLSITLTFF